MKAYILTAVLVASSLLLQGCALLVVGAGAGIASAAHDRRSLGAQLDDKTTHSRTGIALNDVTALKEQGNISINVFNGVVLLVGQVPNEQLKQQAGAVAAKISNVKKVHNQIRIAEPIAASSSAHDVWLANKVRTILLADEAVEGLHISVTVADSEVFLMGLVSKPEADATVEAVRNINGVAKVIKVFEYL